MSKRKKKKKLARKKLRRSFRSNVCDMHHLCWVRKRWSSSVAHKFRLHPYCIVSIPKNTLHWYIHQNMTHIPVPTDEVLRNALHRLEIMELVEEIRMDDQIEKRLQVLVNLFAESAPSTAEGFRTQLRLVHEFNQKSPS